MLSDFVSEIILLSRNTKSVDFLNLPAANNLEFKIIKSTGQAARCGKLANVLTQDNNLC